MTYLWTFGAAFLRLTALSSLGAKQKQKKMQRFRGPLSEARLQGLRHAEDRREGVKGDVSASCQREVGYPLSEEN